MSQSADLLFGLSNEVAVHKQIENTLGISLLKTGGKYDPYDFYDLNNTFVELKSRRIKHNQYPTALVGQNKIQKIQEGNHYYFFFSYEDGLYYIKYDKALFDTFHIQDDYYRGNRSDCPNYAQALVHIPVDKLSPAKI